MSQGLESAADVVVAVPSSSPGSLDARASAMSRAMSGSLSFSVGRKACHVEFTAAGSAAPPAAFDTRVTVSAPTPAMATVGVLGGTPEMTSISVTVTPARTVSSALPVTKRAESTLLGLLFRTAARHSVPEAVPGTQSTLPAPSGSLWAASCIQHTSPLMRPSGTPPRATASTFSTTRHAADSWTAVATPALYKAHAPGASSPVRGLRPRSRQS
mmetsp:Transcript_4680/g.11575  ORF Transcript_4680/g.11575 Transcript_4680/m.11575 type:complete len:214 (+) Transcript_4680:5563-6204(+)